MRECIAVAAGLLLAALVGAGARAARPPEALETEERAQAAELDHLIKKADALSASMVERREHLRKRLRAMYKLSQGGYLRLLLGAETPAELFARRDGMRRVIGRDLDELESVQAELGELAGVREALREGERRAAELATEARDERPEGLARRGALVRPVDGEVVAPFGPFRDEETGVELGRDGVELRALPGEAVRAAAAGEVRSVAEVEGLGTTVIVDHGQGWRTLIARLAQPRVRAGSTVAAGDPIARAAGATVHLELAQGAAWLDPVAWFAPPPPDAHRHHHAPPPPRARHR
jgi:septal ring factor EnvC (AmiA/AmiB activator)